jgi:hypothetical protein
VPLPRPTVELVNNECAEFDRENQLTEDALRQLRERFPQNSETAHVLLKVLVLNKLYNARVRDIDVEPLARHVASLQLDSVLEKGAPTAVALITNCEKLKKYFSFATKFCSWHNPVAYPMYDGNVDECLWSYQRQDRFAKFHRQDLGSYEKLIAVVAGFRAFYGLESFSFRQLDKFLWRLGERILSAGGSAAFP